jgi:hypothetical protein
MSQADMDLVCTMRDTALPLTLMLGSAAEWAASGNEIPVGRGLWLESVVSLARAVLGGGASGGDGMTTKVRPALTIEERDARDAEATVMTTTDPAMLPAASFTETAPGCPVVHGGEEWSAVCGAS